MAGEATETVADAAVPEIAAATLLLVDDEPSILSALRRLLRPQGYRVLTAPGGAEGLALASENTLDLVISDMRMPGMDGARFLAQVRQRQPNAVRILLTGYADMQSTIAAINDGAIHRYIAKPWDDNDLLLVVREALDRRRLEQHNRELTALVARQNDELRAANAGLEQRVRERTAEIAQVNDMLNLAYAELKTNFLMSMKVFAGLLELRHSGMSGHSLRVAEWARRVCARLQLDERSSHDIFVAALLHNIGKIGLPDGLLAKPVSLMTAEETARYRRHPLNAESALMPLTQLQPVARMVRAQQERFDGNGYPDGLEGEEIPLGARVLAPIIDFENLVGGRLAQKAYSAEDAIAAVRRGAAGRYDPRVVDALLEVLAEPQSDDRDDDCISAAELVPGMVLSRDLVSPQGTLLLAAGYTFDARVVAQVHEYARRENAKLSLYIRRDTPPAARAT